MGKPTAQGPSTQVYTNETSSATRPAPTDDVVERPDLTRTLSRMSTNAPVQYKVYKRRFFGLVQLVLLNIVVSWGWIMFASISGTTAQYFDTSENVINWLSTTVLFAFVVASPFTFYALAKHGPKVSIVASACLLLVGSWIKYGGTRANNYGVVMFGQLLLGFAQPFVLASPSTYSNVWFSPQGRTSATAVASLANPLGAALGQLISPFWATDPSQIPNTVLYTTLITTVACVPSFFIPSKPPTPPSSATTSTSGETIASLRATLYTLFTSLEFYLIFIPFSVLVGFFNAFSTVLNQVLSPWGFSEDDAGIAGALLIFVGLASAAVCSPLMDKYKFYLTYIKTAVPILSLMYLVLIWAPGTRSLGYVDVVCAVIGASSFGLVPVILEFLVEIFHPLGPEVGSTVCWCGGQLLGGIFIIVMEKMKGSGGGSNTGSPKGEMTRALIFQAVIALAVVPLPLCLGLFGRKDKVRRRRWEAEQRGAEDDIIEEDAHDDMDVRSNDGLMQGAADIR